MAGQRVSCLFIIERSAAPTGVWRVRPALEDRLMMALAKRGIDGRATWIAIILEDQFPCSEPPCCQLESFTKGHGGSVEMKRTPVIHIIWLVTSRRQQNPSTRGLGYVASKDVTSATDEGIARRVSRQVRVGRE